MQKLIKCSSHKRHALQILRNFLCYLRPFGNFQTGDGLEDPEGAKEGSLGDLRSPGNPKITNLYHSAKKVNQQERGYKTDNPAGQ